MPSFRRPRMSLAIGLAATGGLLAVPDVAHSQVATGGFTPEFVQRQDHLRPGAVFVGGVGSPSVPADTLPTDPTVGPYNVLMWLWIGAISFIPLIRLGIAVFEKDPVPLRPGPVRERDVEPPRRRAA